MRGNRTSAAPFIPVPGALATVPERWFDVRQNASRIVTGRHQQNALIESLPPRERKAFAAELDDRPAAAHEVLALAGRPVTAVYFPAGAVISALYRSNGLSIEVHGAGREGMLGSGAVFGPERLRADLVVQIAGPVRSMPLEAFRRRAHESEPVARMLARYNASVLVFLTQSIACNGMHTIAQRTARCLLVTADRAGSDGFPVTHELLARRLGVRRPGVSLAVKRLARLGIVDYRLGRLRISDRDRLAEHACECYGAVAAESARIMRDRKKT